MSTDGIRKRKLEPIDLSREKKIQASEAEILPELPLGAQQEEEKPSFIEKYAAEERERGIVLTDDNGWPAPASPPVPPKRTIRTGKIGWGLTAGGIAMVISAALASTIFAKLTVTLKLRTEEVALKEIAAVFDTSVSRLLLPQRVLPAQKLEFSRNLTEEFEATGTKKIADKARGKVKIYNGFSSSPQSLVASTRFVTDSGVLFRIERTITIPGAEINEGKIVPKFIEAELVADQAGDTGNIPEGVTLKIPGFKGSPKYEGFFAQTSTGFSGGYVGEARVASRDDIKKAQEHLTQKAYDELQKEILRKIPADFKLIDQLREIEITKIEAPKPDSKHDRFPVEVRSVARVVVFRESDVQELVRDLVLKNDSQKEIVDGSQRIDYLVKNIDFNKGKADILLQGAVKVKPTISQDEFAALILGKKEGSIIEALKNRPELASFRVAFFPPWLFKSPGDSGKIRFIIEKP